jgi:hypothetical protein
MNLSFKVSVFALVSLFAMGVSAVPAYVQADDFGGLDFGTTGLTDNYGYAGYGGDFGTSGLSGNYGYTGLTGNYGSTGLSNNFGGTDLTGNYGYTGLDNNYGYTGLTNNYGSTGLNNNYGYTGLSNNYGTTGLTSNYGSTGLGSSGTDTYSPVPYPSNTYTPIASDTYTPLSSYGYGYTPSYTYGTGYTPSYSYGASYPYTSGYSTPVGTASITSQNQSQGQSQSSYNSNPNTNTNTNYTPSYSTSQSTTGAITNNNNSSTGPITISNNVNVVPVQQAQQQRLVQYQLPTPSCTISASNYYTYGTNYNQPITLTWSSNNATSAYITPNVGSVAPNGSTTVFPQGYTTYTLTISGPGGSATCQATATGAYNYVAPTYVQPTYVPPAYIPPAPVYTQPASPVVSLTQIPYTGYDFGVVGDALYWLALFAFAAAGAYLVVYFRGGMFAFAGSFVNRSQEEVSEETKEIVATPIAAAVEETTAPKRELPVMENRRITTDSMFVDHSHGAPRIVIARV